MKHVFIINPASGKQNVDKLLSPKISQAADMLGVQAEIWVTDAPKHATFLASEYAKKGDAVRLYAVGGDGTLNEVFAGAYQYENAQVAHLPCGSGNDYIRNFGLVEEFLDIQAQIQGKAISVDLIKNKDDICVAIMSVGLDAQVVCAMQKYRRLPGMGGSMAYNLSIVEKLLQPLGEALDITLDGKEIQDKYLIATVCNGQYYGGGFRAAPCARLDDGMLDIVLVKKISRLKIASIISKYKKGEHFHNGEIVFELRNMIDYHRVKEITIRPTKKESMILNVDGEFAPVPSFTAQVIPKAAKFVIPKDLVPLYKSKIIE